jgi:hypothetical protein
MSLNNEPLLEGESRFHCGAVYHLVRVKGLGSDFVFPLYDLSMRIAHDSGRFFPRMTELEPYLDCDRNQLYNAAARLVEAGFWVVLQKVRGKAAEYRPLSHEDWVATHGDAACCKKAAMPWDDEEQDPLGKALFGVTGGAQFFPQVLQGWRKKSGLPDEQIVARAKEFMETTGATLKSAQPGRLIDEQKFFGHRKDAAFRKRLGEFICDKQA